METSDIKRLKELEAENRKLKRMFAELSVKSHSSSKAWAVQLQ
jgi:putative transposase